MTDTHDTPEAVKALVAAERLATATDEPKWRTAEDHMGAILAALDGWTLVPKDGEIENNASVARERSDDQDEIARLRAVLEMIAEPGCEASRWANEEPPVPDRCLDPDYIEEFDAENGNRCGPCEARAALAQAGGQ